MRRRVSQRQLLLEFDLGLLRYGVGLVRDGQLELNSVGRIELPEEAQERGVPADPEQMAMLLRQLFQEHKITVNQVSVALPPEAAFQQVVDLPLDLSHEQARDLVLDPALGPQLPIPLMQTDFDLVPCGLPLRRDGEQLFRRYLLVAIPSEFTTRVVTTMQLAELNLQRLELGPLAALRLESQSLQQLAQGEFALWLELKAGTTHGVVLAGSGPVAFRRLVSIRDFPEPELTAEQSAMAVDESLCGEEITVHDPRYLAISDLDLRLLITEIREWMREFGDQLLHVRWSRIWISGVNSAHPLLDDMLTEALNVPVQRVMVRETAGLVDLGYARLMLQSGLARLVGLGLGLMPARVAESDGSFDRSWQVETTAPELAMAEPAMERDTTPEQGDALVLDVVAQADSVVEEALQLTPEPERSEELLGPSDPVDASDQPVEELEPAEGMKLPPLDAMDFDPVWPSINTVDFNPEDNTSLTLQPDAEMPPSAWPSIRPPVVAEAERNKHLIQPEPKPSKADSDSEQRVEDSPLGNLRFNDD